MPPIVDKNIQSDIKLVLEALSSHPDYISNILDRVDSGNMISLAHPVRDSWQIGLTDYSTLIYRSFALWRKRGQDPLATLLQNGLVDELAKIEHGKRQEMIRTIMHHPFISRQRGYGIINDLSDESFIEACVSNSESLKEVSDNLAYYRSLPKKSELINQSFEQLILSIVHLAANSEVRKEFKNLATPELVDHIHALPALRKHPNSKKLFANAAKQSEAFQNLVEAILSQNREILDQATRSVVEYTTLPVSQKGNLALEQKTQESFEEMIFSLVELVSTESVRVNLKEMATEQLVNDIYNLDALKNQQSSRKLVSDLAKDNPQGFKDLIETILSQPYDKTIFPTTRKLLTYLSSTDEEVDKNPKIVSDLLLSLYQLAANPEVSAKIAPLLSEGLVTNIFEKFVPAEYQKYKPIAKEISVSLSTNPEGLNSLLKAYSKYSEDKLDGATINGVLKTFSDDKVFSSIISDQSVQLLIDKLNSEPINNDAKETTENILQNAPEVIETHKDVIIESTGNSAYQALKKTVNFVSKLIKSKNTPEKNILPSANTLKAAKYIRELASLPEHDHALDIVNKDKTKEAIKRILTEAPNNSYVKLCSNFGIAEDDLIGFANKTYNSKGLNSIADYLEEPAGVSKIGKLAMVFINTGNITFAIKHLSIGLGNYLKELVLPGKEKNTTPVAEEPKSMVKRIESRRDSSAKNPNQTIS